MSAHLHTLINYRQMNLSSLVCFCITDDHEGQNNSYLCLAHSTVAWGVL